MEGHLNLKVEAGLILTGWKYLFINFLSIKGNFMM